jgi:hypothetical protein
MSIHGPVDGPVHGIQAVDMFETVLRISKEDIRFPNKITNLNIRTIIPVNSSMNIYITIMGNSYANSF